MKNIFTLLLFCCFGIGLFSQSRIYVDHFKKGAPVAPSMYGIFFEEISHAGDGGLYAELIQNRGFEEHVLPSGCTLKNGRAWAPHSPEYRSGNYKDYNIAWDTTQLKFQAWTLASQNCDLKYDVVKAPVPLHTATPHALKLDIKNFKTGGTVTVRNSGYWGIPVNKNEKFDLRFYLKTDKNYRGKVTAKITSNSGTTAFTEKEFQVDNSGEWTEYTAELTAGTRTTLNGAFILEFDAPGTVYVDYVSLFPQNTFKGQKNGLRKDIAEFVADLKPAFVRWPGGCVVEGMTVENRVKWKETLGDPMTRRGEYNRWGYRTTMGWGYHEFLQYCEDVNADAMFVASVGISCTFNNGDYVPESEYDKFVQDIRDAIDYAIGDVNTTWGAKRAAAGHPEPFPLKYVELGNENWGAYYAGVYNYFYERLKPEYPDIVFICTLQLDPEVNLLNKVDMIDPHWYQTTDWFYNNTYIFDGRERGKYDIYVGEYACNQNVGKGNMGAALSEAAFMTGMERNGDLVTLTSYAPLLENVNRSNWSTNMIWFDNSRVMGRSSYYVQKMFSEHRPDYNISTSINTDGKVPYEGRVGLETWKTSVMYKNFKVSKRDGSKVFYEADFKEKQADWTPFAGKWTFVNDTYRQIELEDRRATLMNKWVYNDCIIEVEAMKTDGVEGFIVVFGAEEDLSRNFQVNIGGWSNRYAAFESVTNGSGAVISKQVPFNVTSNRWYKIKVELTGGNHMKCYVDGNLVVECDAAKPGKIQSIAGYDKTTGESIIKVVNAESTALNSTVFLNAKNIASEGKIITLSADSPTSENSLTSPTLISPIETTFNGFKKEFEYSFKPYSVTIMRVKADEDIDSGIQQGNWYSDEPIPLAIKDAKTSFNLRYNKIGENLWSLTNDSRKIEKVAVNDLNGRILFEKPDISEHAYTLDLTGSEKGVYLVEVDYADNRDVIKLVKN